MCPSYANGNANAYAHANANGTSSMCPSLCRSTTSCMPCSLPTNVL
jgi:hypothetical protein